VATRLSAACFPPTHRLVLGRIDRDDHSAVMCARRANQPETLPCGRECFGNGQRVYGRKWRSVGHHRCACARVALCDMSMSIRSSVFGEQKKSRNEQKRNNSRGKPRVRARHPGQTGLSSMRSGLLSCVKVRIMVISLIEAKWAHKGQGLSWLPLGSPSPKASPLPPQSPSQCRHLPAHSAIILYSPKVCSIGMNARPNLMHPPILGRNTICFSLPEWPRPQLYRGFNQRRNA
jgi:hypothetical protein